MAPPTVLIIEDNVLNAKNSPKMFDQRRLQGVIA